MARGLLSYSGMHRDPSMGEALGRAVEAGQSLVVGRLELLASEAKLFFRAGGTLLFIGALALAGWIFLMAGLTDGLAQHYPRFAVESAVGVAHVGVALLCFLRMRAK